MYKYHCENLRKVEFAIKQVQRDLRHHIARQNMEAEIAYTRILSYLVVCWTETSLLKLINQPNLFHETEISEVLRKRSLETKWKGCLEIAVRRCFEIPKKPILSSLPFTHKAYYRELSRIITQELLPSIEVRNKVVHGQWQYAFKTDTNTFSSEITKLLRLDNILALQLRMKILKTMVSIITDYCVSPDLVARDFDKKYKIVEQQVINMHRRKYSDYKTKMRDKYQRGAIKRDDATISGWQEEIRSTM